MPCSKNLAINPLMHIPCIYNFTTYYSSAICGPSQRLDCCPYPRQGNTTTPLWPAYSIKFQPRYKLIVVTTIVHIMPHFRVLTISTSRRWVTTDSKIRRLINVFFIVSTCRLTVATLVKLQSHWKRLHHVFLNVSYVVSASRLVGRQLQRLFPQVFFWGILSPHRWKSRFQPHFCSDSIYFTL
jgi:hypothetical protein